MAITLWEYYCREAERIEAASLTGIGSIEDWQSQRPERHREFMQSMGLDPLPDRCDLRTTRYATFAGEGFAAQNLAYQLFPDVWSTACLYRPDPVPAGKAPAVLYVCGHGISGVQHYQRHAAMWARRGYVCLIIDTIEQNDNPGDHHEFYFGKRFDILSMGFTAAGGELWNSIRGLDLLYSLACVDPERVGVTGISGGGAHSFFLGVADERIKVTATAAGVVSTVAYNRLRQLNGHCDCMWPYNPYQRDAGDFAALAAPRPLLFCFAKEDALFDAPSYRKVFEKTRRIYSLYGAEANCELFEYPGPHQYIPDTVRKINAWFDRHLAVTPRNDLVLEDQKEQKERTTVIFNGAPPQPDRLDLLPEILTRRASVALPDGPEDWARTRAQLLGALRGRALHWLDRVPEALETQLIGDWIVGPRLRVYSGRIGGMELLVHFTFKEAPVKRIVLGVAGEGERLETVRERFWQICPDAATVVAELRATGPSEPGPSYYIPTLRAGLSVGLTRTMLWIRDILELVELARSWPEVGGAPITLYGRGDAGVACLYAAALDQAVAGVVADEIPLTHLHGAYIPGVLPVADIEHVIGLVAPRPVGIVPREQRKTYWLSRLYDRLGAAERLTMGKCLHTVAGRVLERT